MKLTKEKGLKAKVLVKELLGSEIQIHIHVQEQIHTVKTDASTIIKAGDIITVMPMENKIHLFDPETEKALLN